MLTKEQILSADDMQKEVVSVPEWGGDVWVRAMSASERDKLESEQISARRDKRDELSNIRARVCARCIVDDEGNRMFDESDIEALGQKSAAALDRVFDAAQRLNGLSEKDVEALEKN